MGACSLIRQVVAEARFHAFARTSGQVECPSQIHNLWCSVGAKCSFCKAVL